MVQAAFPPGAAPAQVSFTLDGAAPVAAVGPLFSLGGDESDGKPRRTPSWGCGRDAHR